MEEDKAREKNICCSRVRGSMEEMEADIENSFFFGALSTRIYIQCTMCIFWIFPKEKPLAGRVVPNF